MLAVLSRAVARHCQRLAPGLVSASSATMATFVTVQLASPNPFDFLGINQALCEAKNVFGRYSVSDAVEEVMPAVVNITATAQENHWFGGKRSVGGSGFIIDKEGTVLTNAHVVVDGLELADHLEVQLTDGRIFRAMIKSYDTASDVAVLKIQTNDVLPVAKLGNSASLRVGEWVIAVGSALRLQNTVTVGVVSALERTLTTLGLDKRMSYIQTDAAINVGNSGGPLLNLDGEVVGINTMTARGTQGVSFAIPIDIAKAVMQQLNKSGRVQRPYLGLRMLSLNPDVIDELRETKSVQLPASITSGALVGKETRRDSNSAVDRQFVT